MLDDTKIILDALHAALEPTGVLHEYADPRVAIAYLREHQVDVILTDISMPALPVDGRWFVTEVRKLYPAVPIIINTADDTLSLAALRGISGLDFVLKGPRYAQKIKSTVRRALRSVRTSPAPTRGRSTNGYKADLT
ncbi:MAG: response regulator [Opitutaceae bacterium]